jgi:20S proteasome alpha/beta subunit
MTDKPCKHNWVPRTDGAGGYDCTKCADWSQVGPEHFKVKPQGLTYNYKYIFTGKHHAAIAKVIAKSYQDNKSDFDRQKVVLAVALDMAEMMKADNNKFDVHAFLNSIVS